MKQSIFKPRSRSRTPRKVFNKFLGTVFAGVLVAGLVSSCGIFSKKNNKPNCIKLFENIKEANTQCERVFHTEVGLNRKEIEIRGFYVKNFVGKTCYCNYETIKHIKFIGNPNPESAMKITFTEDCEIRRGHADCLIPYNMNKRNLLAAPQFKIKEMHAEIIQKIGKYKEEQKVEQRDREERSRANLIRTLKKWGIGLLTLFTIILGVLGYRRFRKGKEKLYETGYSEQLATANIQHLIRNALNQLSTVYNNRRLTEEAEMIKYAKVVFTNKIVRSSYDRERNIIKLNEKGIKAYYGSNTEDMFRYYCVMKAVYEIHKAHAGFRTYNKCDLSFLNDALAIRFAHEDTSRLFGLKRIKSFHYETTFEDFSGVFAKLINSLILGKAYFKRDFGIIVTYLREKGISDEEISKLLELIDASSKQSYKSVELSNYLEYLKRKYGDKMNLEEKFLDKFEELKKWIDFDRAPSSIVFNNEQEKQEFLSILKESLKLGRDFRKKDIKKYFESVDLQEYWRYSYAASLKFKREELLKEKGKATLDRQIFEELVNDIKETNEKIADEGISLAESEKWHDLSRIIRFEIKFLYTEYFDKIPEKLWGGQQQKLNEVYLHSKATKEGERTWDLR